jgi:hypothetical protein
LNRNVEKTVIEILSKNENGLSFEELRELLEKNGYYLNGLMLRKIIAKLINSGIICKIPSEKRKKLLLILCRGN